MTTRHRTTLADWMVALFDEPAPLYRRYPGQMQAQPAHLYLTEQGAIGADYAGEIGNAVSYDVFRRLTLTWHVTPDISGAGLRRLVTEVRPLLDRVHAGHKIVREGDHEVGRLTEAGAAAEDEVQEMCDAIFAWGEGDRVEVWDALDWLGGDYAAAARFAGLTADSTPAKIAAAAADAERIARSDNVIWERDDPPLAVFTRAVAELRDERAE